MKLKTILRVRIRVNFILLFFLATGAAYAQQEHPVTRTADLDLRSTLFEQQKLTLTLFDDTQFNANRSFVDRHPNGAISWVGKIANQVHSSVIISQKEDAYWGKIETQNGDLFIIKPNAGRLEVQQLDYTPIDEECTHAHIEYEEGENTKEDEDSNIERSSVADVCLSTSTCTAQTIDLLVVYTAAARTNLGGTNAAADAAIASAVSEMNLINNNSNVSHSFALAHSALVSYTESGDFSTDLDALEDGTDGNIDNVQDLRETYYADAVAMVLGSGGCGLGNVNVNNIQYESQSAFSVVSDNCMTTNKSLAHEVGHNLGFRHDRFAYSSTPSTACDWVWGWVNPGAQTGGASERWRTVMAYNDQCSSWGVNCTRVSHWSNPNVDYNSDPTGSAIGNSDEAHNEYIFERAACQFAEFREPINCTGCEVYQDCSYYNANTSSGPGNTTILTVSGSFNSASASGASPQLCINYYGDHNGTTEQFDVIDENGNTLGQTTPSLDCDIPARVCFTITASDYNSWIANGSVTVTLNPRGTSIDPTLCTNSRACIELVNNSPLFGTGPGPCADMAHVQLQEGNELFFFDANDNGQLALRRNGTLCDNSTIFDDGSRNFYLSNDSGERLKAQVNSTGVPFVKTIGNNASDNVRLTFVSGAEDRAFFGVRNPANENKVEMYAASNDNGYIRTLSPNGSSNVRATFLSGQIDNGFLDVLDGSGTNQAGFYVDANGDGVVFGDTKSFRTDHPTQPDKHIWYACVEGPEVAAYERGTAQLVNGQALVNFSNEFQLISNTQTMTIMLTPHHWDTYGLAVVEKTNNGFIVEELKSGLGNFTFDWEVKCVRKGYENFQVIRDKTSSMPLPIIVKEGEGESIGTDTEQN